MRRTTGTASGVRPKDRSVDPPPSRSSRWCARNTVPTHSTARTLVCRRPSGPCRWTSTPVPRLVIPWTCTRPRRKSIGRGMRLRNIARPSKAARTGDGLAFGFRARIATRAPCRPTRPSCGRDRRTWSKRCWMTGPRSGSAAQSRQSNTTPRSTRGTTCPHTERLPRSCTRSQTCLGKRRTPTPVSSVGRTRTDVVLRVSVKNKP